MRFSVRHATTYRYSAPVRFGDQRLRLSPRPEFVKVRFQQIRVAPEPSLRREMLDRYANPVLLLQFATAADTLVVESSFELDTFARLPVAASELPRLPWRRGSGDPSFLPDAMLPRAVVGFAQDLAERADWVTADFLDRLNEALFTRISCHIRPDGATQSVEETLASGVGACRDMALLFMACARALGIPARFVSGYQARPESVGGPRHLHAWPEVFLPGFGWRGYDPTHGERVTDRHVAVSIAPDQAGTKPVEGGFYGMGVTSSLSYEIEIHAV